MKKSKADNSHLEQHSLLSDFIRSGYGSQYKKMFDEHQKKLQQGSISRDQKNVTANYFDENKPLFEDSEGLLENDSEMPTSVFASAQATSQAIEQSDLNNHTDLDRIALTGTINAEEDTTADHTFVQKSVLDRRTAVIRLLHRHHLLQYTINAWLSNASLLPKRAAPITQPARLNSIKTTEAIFDGLRLHLKWLWPAVFAGLGLHDLVYYISQPQYRYGNSGRQLFLGLSTNQLSWSSRLGHDIPDTPLYWLAPATIALAPIATMIINLIVHHRLWEHTEFASREYAATYIRPLFSALSNHTLSQAEFMLCWDGRIAEEECKQSFHYITKMAKDGRFFTPVRALESLAKIADSFDYHTLQRTKLSEEKMEGLMALRRQALAALHEHASRHVDPLQQNRFNLLHYLRYAYANYLLWTLNEKPLLSKSQLYTLTWLYTPYALYANIRLAEIIVRKIKGKVEFNKAQAACQAKDKNWDYQIEKGDYDCTVCGDWDGIPLAEVYTSQDCLSALLRLPLSPPQLLAKLPRLLSHKGIAAIDLSHHAWTNWEYTEWDAFLTQIETANITQLHRLNLTHAIAIPIPPQADKILRLADFFNRTSVANIALNKLGLGAENIAWLAPALTDSASNSLDLTANGLEDEGLEYLMPYLSNATKVLNLSSNRLGQIAAKQIAQSLSNLNLTALNLSHNIISEVGIIELMEGSQGSTLQTMDLSFNPLTRRAVEAIGAALTKGGLIELRLGHTGLDDIKIKTLAPYLQRAKALDILDLSGNAISNQGVTFLLSALRNTTVKQLLLADNRLTDNSLTIMQRYIPDTSLLSYDLSSNHFSSLAFQRFVASLNNTTIERLAASDNNFNDDIIPGFIALFSNDNTLLKQLDLANNRLTSQGIAPLFSAASNTSLVEIYLANNHIDADIADTLSAFVRQSSVKVLDLRNNYLDETVANNLARVIPHSQLETLLLDDNFLGREGSSAIAVSLIKPLPNMADYAKSTIDLDAARALAKAQTSSPLTRLGLTNTGLDKAGARLFCHIQPYTEIPFEELRLAHNIPPFDSFNITTCEQLTRYANNQRLIARNQDRPLSGSAYSLLSLAIPFIQVLLLFYVLYRLAAPLLQRISGNNFSFFKTRSNNDVYHNTDDEFNSPSLTQQNTNL